MPQGGRPNGVKHERKKTVTGEYKPRYQKATKKEKKAIPDEFIRLTGYRRKSAVRLLNAKRVKQAAVYMNGTPLKIRRHRGNCGKAQEDKPRARRPAPQKRQGCPQAERGKPHEPPDPLKSRVPVRAFYASEERKKPGFWQTGTVHHCGQATQGQYPAYVISRRFPCSTSSCPLKSSKAKPGPVPRRSRGTMSL